MIVESFRKKHGIHLALLEWVRRKEPIVAPNFFVSVYEMDVMAVSKDEHLIEYEVKISLSDYTTDFYKSHYENGNPVMKHDLIKTGKRVNKFYFVVTAEMVSRVNVPDYAGLIGETETGFKVFKKAPLIHDGKPGIEFYKALAKSLSWREHGLRSDVRVLKARLKSATSQPVNNA